MDDKKRRRAVKPGGADGEGQAKEPQADTEGHFMLPDPELNRTLAREREREIQRNLRTESRRPFFRRGR